MFSHLTKWHKGRKTAIPEGLAPRKRGPESRANPLTVENRKLRRDNERLPDRLRKAEIVLDVQKHVAMLLGLALAGAGGVVRVAIATLHQWQG